MQCRPVTTWLLLSLMGLGSQTASAQTGGSIPAPAREAFHQDVAWSPDASSIAYSEFSVGPDTSEKTWSIWIAQADGSERRRVVDHATWVTWSPDGLRLAFASERDGNSDIYTVGVDGENLRRITSDEASDSHPAWAPDGSRIAYVSGRGAHQELYTMTPAGDDVQQVSFGKTVYAMDDSGDIAETFYAGDAQTPQWSPGSDRLVFYRSDGTSPDQVHVCAANGSGEYSVTDDSLHNIYPSFVEDGLIAYSSRRPDGSNELVTVMLDGTSRTPVGDVNAFFARWSPDRTQIAFIAGRWPETAIYIMRVDDSQVRKIIN